MSLQDKDEAEVSLPAWAIPPKGKGVADHLKHRLLDKLLAEKVELKWWKAKKSKTWTSLVAGLLALEEPHVAELIIRAVLEEHRARFSKQFSLD